MDSQWIYPACAIIATIVLIVVAFFVIKTLKILLDSLNHINSSLTVLKSKIEPLSNETVRLLENSNEIAESLQEKLSDLDPIMGSISNIGVALQNATKSLSHEASEEKHYRFFSSEKKNDWQDLAGDIIQLATLGVMTWQKIKKGR